MKSLTVQLPDEIVDRAERCAAERGALLTNEVADFVRHYGERTATAAIANGTKPTAADRSQLFAALDAGRNDDSVGALGRDELYDRSILH